MPTIVGYQFEGDVLEIYMPISRSLVRDACDAEAVAKMAGELASKSAYDAVIKRRAEYDAEEI